MVIHETAEVIFRIVVSANQLSFYGVVADMCEELTLSNSGNCLAATGQPVAMEKPESLDLLNVSKPILTNQRVQGNFLLDHKQRIENLPGDDRLIKLCSDAGFIKTVAPRQYSLTADVEEF